MPNHRQHQKKRSKAKRKNDQTKRMNFVPEAGPGCHLAVMGGEPWVLDWETVDPRDYADAVPDIGIDPEGRTISLCNVDDAVKIAYITVFDVILRGKHGQTLRQGSTIGDGKDERKCTTLIVQCPAFTFCHLCHFPCDPQTLTLESDVQVWNEHPNTADTCDRVLGFPIKGDEDTLLCTQGEGGKLTHFFRGNYHAVDFRCPIGTAIVAVGNARVVDVKDSSANVSGIGVANLYRWNSILLQIDQTDLETLPEHFRESHHDVRSSPEVFVEYVHIQTSNVQVGDRVQRGQALGTSGSAGFSPEPHLHFAAYRSRADDAPTCRVYFAGPDGAVIPMAGQSYRMTGL